MKARKPASQARARKPRPDRPDPTLERLHHARGYIHRAGCLLTMRDDALGRALMRSIIDEQQFRALERYASHWACGGFNGLIRSIDLNRIPASHSDSEGQLIHRNAWWKARCALSDNEAYVCTMVACQDVNLTQVGILIGYRSRSRGRQAATALLQAGADTLVRYFDRCR